MKIRTKVIGWGILVLIICITMYLLGVRQQFIYYLKEQYPKKSFKVGMVVVDILYDKYYANIICREDQTEFYIRKYFSNSKIDDNYWEAKRKKQNTEKSKALFKDTMIEQYISHVSLIESKIELTDKSYEEINISLVEKCNHIDVMAEILKMLTVSNIKVANIHFTYEKTQSVYEVQLNTSDELTKEDIESKVIKIK
ncbi:hypothetical protein CS063_09240 [Sporanaerobium hydrogeniformans]|uniref:Uncharacterized protein n=1 Tax=Sporanaerobium hydrogeniformans TaxID=3072179 RepID=A0AC61DBQ9_9FIRM|nr:hypothetical protein [Sporanaerobium hydrogeniformans]PHV70704.1 hypothetical protein CS063_09240 [Sporanaerobium hydrogeniformans]